MATIAQIRNLSPVYDVTLDGGDLWSKFGFRDGDMVMEHVYEVQGLEEFDNMLYDVKKTTIFDDVCLMALVELYLLPKFDRSLTLYFDSYVHNAVRVEELEWWDHNNYDWVANNLPSVTITGIHVLEIMTAMRSVFEQWLAGQPMTFPAALKQTAHVIADELKCQIIIDNQLEFTCPSPKLLPSADKPQS